MSTSGSAGAHGGSAVDGGSVDRPADWYELLFDLVFVAVVAVSAHLIEVEPGLASVGVFLLLFFPLWWGWVNVMVTNDLIGVRLPVTGLFVVAAMPGPAAMAIAISGGITEYGWLYALGGAWIRLVLLVLWLASVLTTEVAPSAAAAQDGEDSGEDGGLWRSRVRGLGMSAIPLWRPLTYNLGTAVIWIASVGVPEPYRYVLWGAGIAIEMLLLSIRPGYTHDVYRHVSVPHHLERVGLFVVIVIGEAVYLTVTGLAAHPTPGGAAAGFAGFIACALLARSFFRWAVPTAERALVAAQQARSYGTMRDVVMYLPFFLVAALTLISASIGVAVSHAEEPLDLGARLVLAAGVAGFSLVSGIIGARLGRPIGPIALWVAPGVVLPLAACLATGALPAWATLAFVALTVAMLELVSAMIIPRTTTRSEAI